MEDLRAFCQCPLGKLAAPVSETTPCRSSEDAEDAEGATSSLAGRASGWLAVAMAPLAAYREYRATEEALRERTAVLHAGAEMRLLSSRAIISARVALSADGAMITWRSCDDGGSESGVMALSAVREAKRVSRSGIFFGSATPVPLQWMLVADDETGKFEATTEAQVDLWLSTLQENSTAPQEMLMVMFFLLMMIATTIRIRTRAAGLGQSSGRGQGGAQDGIRHKASDAAGGAPQRGRATEGRGTQGLWRSLHETHGCAAEWNPRVSSGALIIGSPPVRISPPLLFESFVPATAAMMRR